MNRRFHALLVGKSRPVTVRFFVLAVAVLVLASGLQLAAEILQDSLGLVQHYWIAVVFLAGAGATANAYRNDGVLLSWLFGVFGILPFTLALGIADPLFVNPSPLEILTGAVRDASVFGIALGTIGYLLGIGLRRFSSPQSALRRVTRRQ